MSTLTPNYGLIVPDGTDTVEQVRADYATNLNTIDANLGGGGGSSTLAGLSDVNLTSPVTNDALIYDGAEWVNSPLSAVAFSGDYSDLSNAPTIPTKTSDLYNDSDFVSDSAYVHTDNNFTNADVTKLSGIQAGAEVNVQSDWNEADNTADDYIKNKPTIPTNTSDLNNDSGFLDSSDITVTQVQTTGTKIATIDVDGNSTDLYAPTGGGGTYTEGDGIDISAQNEISVDTTFTEAVTRTNIASGDTFSTILGKIRKWFTDIPNMFLKLTGGTLTGALFTNATYENQIVVDRNHSNTTSQPATVHIGNNTPDGTAGSTYGVVRLLGKGARATNISAPDSSSYNPREIKFPDKDGTVALTSDVDGKVSKSGDTMTGNLNIVRTNTYSALALGSDTPSENGVVAMYSTTDKYVLLQPVVGVTENRDIRLPNGNGILALTSYITFGLLLSKNWNYSAFSVTLDSSSAIILYGARSGKAVFSIFPPYPNEIYDIKNDFGITFSHSISGNSHTIGLSAPTSTVGSGCYLYFLGSPV